MATKEIKRVLLTGAGGAIGVHVLAHILKNTDWFIVCTDSFKADHKGYFDRISTLIGPPIWKNINGIRWLERMKVITHDLCSPFTPRQIEQMGKIDYVINLASRSDVQNSIIDPLPFVRNNTEIMLTMLELARDLWGLRINGAKPPEGTAFIHFSTDEVYGSVAGDSGGHKEWSPIVPSNPYSASKASQEALAIAWWRSYGVPLIITNTMNNFGEMQAPSKFPAMIQQKIEKGEVIKVHSAKSGEIGTRYYLHSRNSADAIIFILKNIKPAIHSDGHADLPVRLNIVGDKQVSNLELVQTIGKLMGKEPKYELAYFHEDNPGHDLHYGLNGEKLASLGWKSPVSFEESLKNTIEWQQRNPIWMK